MFIRDKNLKDLMFQVDGCRVPVATLILAYLENKEKKTELEALVQKEEQICSYQTEKGTNYIVYNTGAVKISLISDKHREKAEKIGWTIL